MRSYDDIWDKIYESGRSLNRYPIDAVVSFVYKYHPKDKSRNETKILEVGCGAGNNLWFAAREGFSVWGIDGSKIAIEYAQKRFVQEGLTGNFCVGDFTKLPFADEMFDLVIDRAAITCAPMECAKIAVSEVRRVLKKGGYFFFNVFSDEHTSRFYGAQEEGGVINNIQGGSLTDVGQICFYSSDDIDKMFSEGWKITSKAKMFLVEQSISPQSIHAEWRVIAQKL